MSEGFQFKQFYVRHDRCAMKVGTDGVLLGAWAPVCLQQSPITIHQSPISNHQSPFRVLDIGTGTGLVALMLAQRCPGAQIDAIDIDADAVAQAQENFLRSPWADRLTAHHSSLQEWGETKVSVPSLVGRVRERLTYSLIVSNPPYFQNSLKNPDAGRQTARHTDTLSYAELFHCAAELLPTHGQFAVILPAEAEEEACRLAAAEGLTLARLTRVYSKESKPARRVLMAFQPSAAANQPPQISRLVLEDNQGGRSAAYQQLAQDFYL